MLPDSSLLGVLERREGGSCEEEDLKEGGVEEDSSES